MLPRVFSLVCYFVALAGCAAFALFVLLLGLARDDLAAVRLSLQPAWAVDTGWLVVFSLQHSGMARSGFKRLWQRVVGARLERSIYAAVSGCLLLILPVVWQPLSGKVLYRLPQSAIVIPMLAALALALINAWHDHAGLFGLRQAWSGGEAAAEERLDVDGPYRYVRHPLMGCLLLFLWCQPTMSADLLILSGGLSLMILAGIFLEERDLGRRFGPEYERYRRRVPMLVPYQGRVSTEAHE